MIPEVTDTDTLNQPLSVVAEKYKPRGGNKKGATRTAGGGADIHSTCLKSPTYTVRRWPQYNP